MRLVAYIFAIVGTVLSCSLLVPLAWTIPMTIAIKKSIGDGKEHIALGVCSLIFLSLVSGILLLVSGCDEKNKIEMNNNQSQNKEEITEIKK